jgi:hypothetical protein
MKRIKYYLITLAACSLLFSSCSSSFLDLTTDPSHPKEATPALVLTSAVAGSAYVFGGYYLALGGFWSQQYAQAPAASQWSDWESYNLTEDQFDRQFQTLYAGALYDYEYVRTSAGASKNWSYYSIATLMQAYTFQVVADLYDQIPFTQALKGSEYTQPLFDKGSVIYDSLFLRIDDAMSKDFSAATSEKAGSNDLVFGGDMSYWQKFANTLKLKMYLRYVNTDSTKYQNQIVALLAENNFLDKDATFTDFKDQQTGWNPFYSTFINDLAGNVVANSTLTKYLTAANDTFRLKTLFNPSATGKNYDGVATGAAKSLSGNTINNYATPAITGLTSVYFFSKEEVQFLIAEAQYRYGSKTTAKDAYNAGIKASFASLGCDASKDSLYLAMYPFDGIKSIMEQKWVAATNKNSLESFFDYNRTGYPNIFTTSLTSVLSGSLRPKRLFFPYEERQTNKNTPQKVALYVPVWWAK